MTSSPPATDIQINPSGTTVPPINPQVLVTSINTIPSTQYEGTSSQNPLSIHWPPLTISRTNLSYNVPTHHTDRPIPSVPFPDLVGTPAINTPNLNTFTQTLNLPSSSKKAMIRNIQAQIELMKQ